MGDYFKPLRRKIGIVTLLLAAASGLMWVRGRVVHDWYEARSPVFTVAGESGLRIMLASFSIFHSARSGFPTWGVNWEVSQDPDERPEHDEREEFELARIGPYWPFGFDFYSFGGMGAYAGISFEASCDKYGLSVILACLSAWLLLSKPRRPKSNQPKAL